MRNTSKILMLVLALVLAVGAVGCSPKPEVVVPVQDIADDLLAMENQFGVMSDLGEEYVTQLCALDYDMLSEYSLNDAMMNIRSSILYVAKVNDTADVDAVKAAFQERLETMQRMFESYLQDQYQLALDGKIVDNGKYILLVVSEDSQAIVDRFNELLEG